jgi:hypothetical protein
MSEQSIVLQTFDNEIDAGLARQSLQDAGVQAFIFKDDAGGMEPHLQLTGSVRLVASSNDAERAQQILQAF